MLEQIKAYDFKEIYRIMEESFPDDERRSYEGQLALLARDDYKIYAARDEYGIIAFIAVYEFDTCTFAEHFAISAEHRNRGIGSAVLRELMQMCERRICLEVELPESELTRRRVAFYERNGFFLNDYTYFQPSIEVGKPAIPMKIMSSGRALSECEYKALKAEIYEKVYHFTE